jgi:hypothetical protein
MILWDSSLNPKYYSSLYSMYYIYLVIRFILPDMLYITFLYLLGICCKRANTLRARTAYLSVTAYCFICCFFAVSLSITSTFTSYMCLSFLITVSFRNYFVSF